MSEGAGAESAKQGFDFAAVMRTDLLASVVVFLVALPLCMGIAIASGGAAGASGLITGIVGGLVVGCHRRARRCR